MLETLACLKIAINLEQNDQFSSENPFNSKNSKTVECGQCAWLYGNYSARRTWCNQDSQYACGSPTVKEGKRQNLEKSESEK